MRTKENILVVNAGSSSIKFAVFTSSLVRQISGELEGIGATPHLSARNADGVSLVDRDCQTGEGSIHDLLAETVDWIEGHLGPGSLIAIGHRVATGGLSHSAPVIVTPSVLEKLHSLIPLAPLHQPRNLEPIEVFAKLHPGLPQIACFDSAFHSTMPRIARLYGLPRSLTESGAQRFGYHGLSYEFIASRLPDLDPKAAAGRTVVAHLGSGSSMCALSCGKSIATTMGFSPLSGLVMGTRPGELDAGLLIWMMREKGWTASDVENLLYHESGLKGVSGISSDMRVLLESQDDRAREAVELFVHRISLELGSLTAALGGLDALVFTGGIGEHAAAIRKAVCERSTWLGMHIDAESNEHSSARISTKESRVSVWAIPTDEERMVATHATRLFGQNGDTKRQ